MKRLITVFIISIMSFNTSCITESTEAEDINKFLFSDEAGVHAPQEIILSLKDKVLEIKWDRVLGARYYHLYYAIGINNNYTKVEGKFEDNIANFSVIVSNEIYYFFITSISASGVESGRSKIVSIYVN